MIKQNGQFETDETFLMLSGRINCFFLKMTGAYYISSLKALRDSGYGFCHQIYAIAINWKNA
jgi:hypothetical protein